MQLADSSLELKKKLPDTVHQKIDDVVSKLEEAASLVGGNAELIIENPYIEIINKFMNNMLKPIPAMRKLQNLNAWAQIIIDGYKNGIKFPDNLSESDLKKIWLAYMASQSAGKTLSLKDIIAQSQKIENPDDNKKYKDITASNIVVVLTENLGEIEEYLDSKIPGSFEILREGNYDALQVPDSSDKDEIIRKIELHKLFSPVKKEANTIVALMPVLLTMMYEDVDGLEQVKKDCDNIFNEFSMGAELERITISMKRKLLNKREVDEIAINIVAIEKTIKKIKDALNIKVFSQLRRLKLNTIISDDIYKDSIAIGLELDGLRTEFGKSKVPDEYRTIIMETTRKFSETMFEYTRIIESRLSEEIGVNENPNLKMLHEFIKNVNDHIEKYYMMIPPHIAPIYAGAVENFRKTLEDVINILEPLKSQTLTKLIKNQIDKAEFYGEVGDIYVKVSQDFALFNNFFELGLKMSRTDNEIALQFLKNSNDEELYNQNYRPLIEKSMKNLKRMRGMNTLSKEKNEKIHDRIMDLQDHFNEFVKNWSFKQIRDVLSEFSS